MTGAATLATEQAVLGHTLGFAPMPPAARVYVGLCMAAPPPSEGVAGIEVSGAGYLRMPATFALLSSPANAAANAAAVAFPPAAAAWGQIGWFEVWDAPTGGRRLYWGQLADPSGDGVPIALTIAAADIVRFSPGALVIQITNTEAITGGPYLLTAGGTMTGALLLAANPQSPLEAAPKQYVDASVPPGGPWLPLTGGSLSGALLLAADPAGATGAATKQYVDATISRAGGPFLQLTGGVLSGSLTLAADPTVALGAATKQYVDASVPPGGPFLPLAGGTVAGNVTINGVVAINSLMRDPVTETINNTTFTTLTLTANNAQDSLNHVFRMHTDTNGFVSTSGHSPAVYGETSAIDTVPGGTLTWAAGVMGVSGNNGIGTVVNACDFMGHPTINSVAGGTVTNHYILFGPSSLPGKATNEYGFSMPAPSGIGTTTPVAWLEIRVADSLPTTRIARFRNNTGPIIDITADSIVALTGSLGIGTTTPAGLLEVRGATALSTDRLLRVRNNAGSVLDIMANQSIGLFGVAPATRQTVSGAWAGNTAGKALCVALAAYGLIIDSTSA